MKLSKLEKNLNFYFKNKNLLIQAISHKSYSEINNERLEFLGDSVLNFVITKNIYIIYPGFNEGNMTKIRSFLINSKILFKISKKLKIDNFIKIKNSYNKISNSIIENTFESIIAAMFIDQGIYKVERFIINQYSKYLNLIFNYSLKVIKDSKTSLQEISKKIFFSYPLYILNKTIIHKDNKKKFYITCKIIKNNVCLIKSGVGFSKKEAEKLSAKKMLSFIKYKKLV